MAVICVKNMNIQRLGVFIHGFWPLPHVSPTNDSDVILKSFSDLQASNDADEQAAAKLFGQWPQQFVQTVGVFYRTAGTNIETVSSTIVDDLEALLSSNGVPPNLQIEIVAHSMGGIVTGLVGRRLLEKNSDILTRIYRIHVFDTPWYGLTPECQQLVTDGLPQFLGSAAGALVATTVVVLPAAAAVLAIGTGINSGITDVQNGNTAGGALKLLLTTFLAGTGIALTTQHHEVIENFVASAYQTTKDTVMGLIGIFIEKFKQFVGPVFQGMESDILRHARWGLRDLALHIADKDSMTHVLRPSTFVHHFSLSGHPDDVVFRQNAALRSSTEEPHNQALYCLPRTHGPQFSIGNLSLVANDDATRMLARVIAHVTCFESLETSWDYFDVLPEVETDEPPQ